MLRRILNTIALYVRDFLLLFFPTDASIERAEKEREEAERTGKWK